MAISLLRAKYYCGWLLVQAGLNLSGLCLHPKDHTNTTHILTVDPALELQHTLKVKLELWNASTQVWLKNYVYFRVYSEEQIRKSPAKANVSQYTTFVVSALWHGFYPSYYLAFLSTGVLNQVAKYLFKFFNFYAPLCDKVYLFQNPVYILARFLLVTAFLNYCGIVLQLLDFQSCKHYMMNMHFDVTIMTLLLSVFFGVTQLGQKRRVVKKDI